MQCNKKHHLHFCKIQLAPLTLGRRVLAKLSDLAGCTHRYNFARLTRTSFPFIITNSLDLTLVIFSLVKEKYLFTP